MTRLGAVALAASLAFAPLTASAVTFDATNTIADRDSVTLEPGNAWDFSASFQKGDVAGTYAFTFVNPYRLPRTIDFGATVREVSARFTKGARLQFDGAPFLNSFGGATTDSKDAFITVAAHGQTVLTISFGATQQLRSRGVANITFGATVVPVPVPAAGGLLATAVLGLAALRRRSRSLGVLRNFGGQRSVL